LEDENYELKEEKSKLLRKQSLERMVGVPAMGKGEEEEGEEDSGLEELVDAEELGLNVNKGNKNISRRVNNGKGVVVVEHRPKS